MNALENLWGREPAMVVAFVGAVISLAVSFGLKLTPEQTAGIIAVVQVGLGLLTRSQVTAPANLPEVIAMAESETALALPYIPGEDSNT